jgi:hypothetical protein
MTELKVDEGGRTPQQVQKDLQGDRTVATAGTASGLAALGSPEGKETAKDDHTNSGIKPDAVGPGSPPIGDQKKAAFFTPNGSIPGNSIPSPSGPVPASVIHDEATRNAALETARAGATSARLSGRNGRFRISDEAARRMSPAELRAVAHDRGYGGVEGGRAGVLRKFLDEQGKDDTLQDPPEGHHLGIANPQPVPQPVPGATGATTGNPLATPSRPGGLETPK